MSSIECIGDKSGNLVR